MASTKHQQLLKKYADVIVKVGLNLRKGQRLVISNSRTRGVLAHAAPLVHEVARSAYAAGARYVDVIWGDEELIRIRLQNAARDSLSEYSKWHVTGAMDILERGDAFLTIVGENPDLLSDLNPDAVAAWQKAHLENFKVVGEALSNNKVNWCVVASVGPEWAKKVFPKLSAEKAQAKLWDEIFRATRSDQPNPVRAWKEHARKLKLRAAYMQAKQFSALHYTAPGTDLTLGLPRGHKWITAGSPAANGVDFIPNLPTEEIFTLPDRSHVDGTVTATLPLSYSGSLIENFSVTFEKGRIVKVSAKKGEKTLKKLIETDEGAKRLGEVALVPVSSPIAKSGHLFYNTLFDENASCHLAIGHAYRFTLEGGEAMSEDEFMKSGGNASITHVDFMVGSSKTDIDGIREDGSAEPVMRQGEWAFKA
ncbi:MAG: aminopeptidase [Chloroflexi bacterium]|nr:aminopeptidase [Chloroflexota bacterium]